MVSLNIAVLGEPQAARQEMCALLGKRSNPEDVTFYHTVFSGRKVNVIEPSAYPEKPTGLAFACNLASYAIVIAQEPSSVLGETLLGLSLSGKRHGCVVSVSDVSAYLKSLNLDFPVYSTIEEARLAALAFQPAAVEGRTKAWIDHSFEVRGLGPVALGYVVRGKLSVHQKIASQPLEKQIEIKSIQQNDIDVEHAESSDRFGIRFKGAQVDELTRGSVLSDGAKAVHQIEATVFCPRFLKNPPGKMLHAVAGLQDVSCQTDKPLKPGLENEVLLEFHKPLYLDCDDVWLFDLNAKPLRLAGYARGIA